MNTLRIFAQSLANKSTHPSTNLGGITSYYGTSSCGVFYQLPKRHVFIWISIVLSEKQPDDVKELRLFCHDFKFIECILVEICISFI